MTDHMTLIRPRRRVRPGSERELRLLKLAWLSGWSTADIAALLGDSVRTVRRRLACHDLKGPEAPGEQARLIAEAMKDAIAEGLLCGDNPLVKEVVSTLQKMAGATRTLQQAAREHRAEAARDAPEDEDDWRERAIAEIDRLVGLDAETQDEVSGVSTETPAQEIKSRPSDTRPAAGILRRSAPPAYTGSAAGPGADVAAFGRTYRGLPGSREPPG